MLTMYKWDDPVLKQIWQTFYADNPYLFPYSSWEYNEQIYKYIKVKPSSMFQKNYFLVYEEEKKPLVLFPLYLKKNKLRLFGENISGAGHLDLLYDEAITTKQFENAFSELKSMFPGKTLELRMINERSKLFNFLKGMAEAGADAVFPVKAEEERVCVKIPFPDDYPEYEKGFNSHARNNLHRAYKKVRSNELDMSLQVIQGPFTDKALLSDAMKIYTKRESERKNRRIDFIPYIKHRYFSALLWAMETLASHYTFCFFLNNKLVAFMTGFVTNYNEIVFPYLAIDSTFASYAPGKLMIAESIKYLQEHSAIRVLDLSRGDEKYKFEMGGIRHHNYRFEIEL